MLHGRGTGPWSEKVPRKFARVTRGVPILMYHLVSPRSPQGFSDYTVTPERFEQQMQKLRRLQCVSISPDDLLAASEGRSELPPRAVLITFDDGFRDCLHHAAPVLVELGLTATMYVVAGQLGGRSRWMTGVELELLNNREVLELERAGVRCESHAMTHPRLATLDTDGIRRELRDSRAVLEDVLGHEVRHIAYPHGSYDERVLQQARLAGYVTGYTTRPAKALRTDDPLAMPRVKVDGRDKTVDFLARLTLGKDAGYPARRVTGRRRA